MAVLTYSHRNIFELWYNGTIHTQYMYRLFLSKFILQTLTRYTTRTGLTFSVNFKINFTYLLLHLSSFCQCSILSAFRSLSIAFYQIIEIICKNCVRLFDMVLLMPCFYSHVMMSMSGLVRENGSLKNVSGETFSSSCVFSSINS